MADRIIKCAAALAGASYHDGPPSAELRDMWREMAADARQEADELRAEVERLKSPAVVLDAAERLLRGARVSEVQFYGRQTIVIAPWSDHGHADTLAEAYEKVRGGQ